MRDVDRFWGLPPTEAVSVGAGPAPPGWVSVVIDSGPPEVRELAGDLRVAVPGLRPVSGEPIVSGRARDGSRVALAVRGESGAELAFDPDAAIAELTGRAALTPRPPLSARLPFHYHRVPRRIRRLVRDASVKRRLRASEAFPSWPVEPSVEVLRAVYLAARRCAEPELEPAPLWPERRRFAVVLTHDVDSPEGMRVAGELAAAEEEHGLRSCWYVVGRDWPLDEDALDALSGASHEIGLHDAHHDNEGPFLASERLGERLDACAALVERYGIRGYRSPSMLRTGAMYEALRGRFAYDSSIPDAALLPVRGGCATVFPVRHEGVPVVPLTLPPDGQLAGLGLDPDAVAERWIEKAEWVARAGGVAVVLTHPEPGFSADPPMQRAYRRFLAWAAGRPDAWHALPSEVAEWWQKRG
jgi:peptidoglycan/xylan/chitin deacetylase (PgdA/CDA1 family)